MLQLEHFIRQHFVAVLVLLGLGLILYIGQGVLEAYILSKEDVNSRKKEPQYWCSKHGWFPRKYCLELFPGMGVESLVCPVCFKESTIDKPERDLRAS